MDQTALSSMLGPILEESGLELDALEIVPAGKRSVLRIVVDGDGESGMGPNLDEIADATKVISQALDTETSVGSGPYVLEVTSRGVHRPLIEPRHWRRNEGRLVRVTFESGDVIEGRIGAVTYDAAEVDIDGQPTLVNFVDVSKAVIQVDMSKNAAANFDAAKGSTSSSLARNGDDPDFDDPDVDEAQEA